MKKRLNLLLVLLFIVSTAVFAGDWIKLDATGVRDVAVADNGTMCMATEAGHFWISMDGGVSWKRDQFATGITRVSINSNGSVVGAVNSAGKFYISKDGGKSWTPTDASGVVDASVGRTYTFITNTAGDVYFTQDYKKWTKTNGGGAKLVIFGGPFIMQGGIDGGVSTADFKGSPLMAYKPTSATGIVDIDVSPDGNLWVVNSAGNMYFSADRGANWTVEPSATGVAAVSLCNKYTLITNTSGIAYFKEN